LRGHLNFHESGRLEMCWLLCHRFSPHLTHRAGMCHLSVVGLVDVCLSGTVCVCESVLMCLRVSVCVQEGCVSVCKFARASVCKCV
jgi:hypothetical protein